MTALADGLRSVRENPKLVLGLWLASVLGALPFAFAVRSSIAGSIGPSLVHENLRAGFDLVWHGEYQSAARGIERSLRPSIAGGGALLDNAEAWLSGKLFQEEPLLVGAGLLYALLWTFLLGGVLDRLARPGEERSRGSFARACGIHFPRFASLAAIAGVLYFGVYRLAGWLMTRLDGWTRDVTVERQVLVATALVWCAIALLLVVVHVWFVLARIALATGEARGVLSALGRGARRLVSSPVRTLGTYLVFAALGAVLVGAYLLVAPGAGPSSTAGLVLAFAIGQAVILSKIGLRVAVLAALTGACTGSSGE